MFASFIHCFSKKSQITRETFSYVGGLALAAFHPQKRAAHDLVVGSEVVYKMRGRK